jgi:predicted transglutaminase-like cysteine proteinase
MLIALVSLSIPAEAVEQVEAPAGFTKYCSTRVVPECGSVSNRNADTTKTLYSDLSAVNGHINYRMVYQRDRLTYGKEEHWADPKNWIGDCEDSVLKKMHYLYAAGWSEKDLRIATAFFYDNKPTATLVSLGPKAANHAILVATFQGVDYVLDSATDNVLTVSDFTELYGAKITSIQSKGGKWTTFN